MTDTITVDLDPEPTRTSPSTFSARMDTWIGKIGTFTTQANALAEGANTNATNAAASAAAALVSEGNASDSEGVALAAANYAGSWSDLTGSLSVPASVGHSSVFWMLTTNLADVTASEPSAGNSDWELIGAHPFSNTTALEQSHAIALYF